MSSSTAVSRARTEFLLEHQASRSEVRRKAPRVVGPATMFFTPSEEQGQQNDNRFLPRNLRKHLRQRQISSTLQPSFSARGHFAVDNRRVSVAALTGIDPDAGRPSTSPKSSLSPAVFTGAPVAADQAVVRHGWRQNR